MFDHQNLDGLPGDAGEASTKAHPSADASAPPGTALVQQAGNMASGSDVVLGDTGMLVRLLREDGGAKSSASPRYAEQLAVLCAAEHTMAKWAAKYLALKVCGRSPNTVQAKARDLATFIKWFLQSHGHADIRLWIERDTRRFVDHLVDLGRKPATINRALATLKHFAGWVHDEPGATFVKYGQPTRDVELLGLDEPDAKKLSHEEMDALFSAARAAVTTRPGRGPGSRYRPRRNLAILGVLYYTGMRISEVLTLRRQQYDGLCFYGVKCKGHRIRNVEIEPQCARLLDSYLDIERPWDSGELGGAEDHPVPDAARPLFLSRHGDMLNRRKVAAQLQNLAKQAEAMMGSKQVDGAQAPSLSVHPHRLRHTFAALYREASGSDAETAAVLGHANTAHVGRYARKTRAERRAVLERVFPAFERKS